MNQLGTYYISWLNLNMNVYVKNPSPEYFKNGSIKNNRIHINKFHTVFEATQRWKNDRISASLCW